MKKENKKKVFTIIEIIVGIIFIGCWIASIILELVMPDTSFAKWLKENIWDINKTFDGLKAQSVVILNSLIYIILIYAICRIIRLILHKQMEKSNRTKTVTTLLDGFIKYGGAIFIIILVLKACGVNTTALIASVGVLTLVVGLGAQSLIADIISGMFIIFENEYNVGEIIAIDGFRGTVTEIGIRSTKLLDTAGNIKIINNSDISNIVNMSRELSLAVVDLDFPYDVPVEQVENILKNNLEVFKQKIPAIVEGPYYKGICGYGDSNVTLKIVAKCKEDDRYQVQRDLMREYRLVLNKNGIDLSYIQVVVNQAPNKEKSKVSSLEKGQAEKFVKEQKEDSKDMEEQTNN